MADSSGKYPGVKHQGHSLMCHAPRGRMLDTVSGTQQASGMAGVEDAVKDFWATRPRRPRRGRKIAGVAAGIADRYRIDPTLVRVALVVATIYGGVGIVLYLLGWLFLPEQDDEVSPAESLFGRGRSSTSSGFTVLLCLALIPAIGGFFGGFLPGFSGYLSIAVVGGALYLLHRHRGHLGQPQAEAAADTQPTYPATPSAYPTAPPPYQAAATPPSGGTTVPLPQDEAPVDPASNEPPPIPERRAAQPEPEPRETPPAWDPLGAAPFAWDLPEPTPQPGFDDEEEPPEPRRKSRVGLLTVGIALITAASLSMVAGGWIDAPHIIGIVLAVLGAGMVVGSFRRGGRGLIGLAVPLAVVGIGMTTIFPNGLNHGWGDIKETPTSLAQVRSDYERSVGSIDLDLTELPASGEVDTTVHLDLGDAKVTVPESANVDLTCQSGLGSVECLGYDKSGAGDNEVTVSDEGTDGSAGLNIRLRVDVGTGSVEVRRG